MKRKEVDRRSSCATLVIVDSETVTSLSYFLLESGSVVDPSSVQMPSEDMLRQSVFDAVAGGRYTYFTKRVFRLDDAFRLYVVGRLDRDDARVVLRAATLRWTTFLGSFLLVGAF